MERVLRFYQNIPLKVDWVDAERSEIWKISLSAVCDKVCLIKFGNIRVVSVGSGATVDCTDTKVFGIIERSVLEPKDWRTK